MIRRDNKCPLGSLLTLALMIALTGCGPVVSGRWYDSQSEKKSDKKDGSVSRYANLVVVRKGDTYFSLSQRYKLPLRALIDANNARPPYTLSAGDQLRIPRQKFYRVKTKDTLYSISHRYKIDVAGLAKLNGIKRPYTIGAGQMLQVSSVQQITSIQSGIQSGNQQVSGVAPQSSARFARTARAPRGKSVTHSRGQQTPARVGRFLVPVKGRVISEFGPKTGGLHNDGINIAARHGTPVKATENGIVVYAGNQLRGYGNLLLIRHSGGWVSAYAHVAKFRVKSGDRVKQGDVIAEVGSTGNVESAQLHFELRKGTRAINPKSLI